MTESERVVDRSGWAALRRARQRRYPVSGTVVECVRGGLIVDVGARAFLPASQVDRRRVRDLQPYVGTQIQVLVVELDEARDNVIVSRRAWLDKVAPARRRAFLQQLRPGGIWSAVVSEIHSDGVVVDFGDFAEGVIDIADLAPHELDNPGELVEIGEQVRVRVLSVDTARQFASLALEPSPDGRGAWTGFDDPSTH